MDVVVIILILHVEKQDTEGWLSDHISNNFFCNRMVKNLQALYSAKKKGFSFKFLFSLKVKNN